MSNKPVVIDLGNGDRVVMFEPKPTKSRKSWLNPWTTLGNLAGWTAVAAFLFLVFVAVAVIYIIIQLLPAIIIIGIIWYISEAVNENNDERAKHQHSYHSQNTQNCGTNNKRAEDVKFFAPDGSELSDEDIGRAFREWTAKRRY